MRWENSRDALASGENMISIKARAKINLSLEVLGRRPDGYHALRSVVMPLDFGDDITVKPTDSGVNLTVVPEGVDISNLGDMEDNLAVRAARLVKARFGIGDGVDISLAKRIPLGGGMGGGSADAAAVLRALNELWGLSLPVMQLAELGAELGSDVPALVLGGAVLMEGRGERVRHLLSAGEGVPMPVVVANPFVHCSTPEVFKAWRPKQILTSCGDIVHNIASFVRTGDVRAAESALCNDLQEPAFSLYPEVSGLALTLRDLGCRAVLLSGSGASVFGLVKDDSEAERMCRELEAKGIWSVATHTCPMV